MTDYVLKRGKYAISDMMRSCQDVQVKQNFGGPNVRAAADWSCDISKSDPARSHRAGAGIFQRARRQGAPDLETDRAGRKRFGADAHPTITFADCPQLDVICVPGGF